jgi:drug/metabolite transporter (DMT)-like permease
LLRRLAPILIILFSVILDTTVLPVVYGGVYTVPLTAVAVFLIGMLMGRMSGLLYGTIGGLLRQIDLPSSAAAFYRGLIGTMTIALVLHIRGHRPDMAALKKRLPLLLLSGAFLGLNWIFLFAAYRVTTVAVASLCNYTAPVIVLILTAIRKGVTWGDAFAWMMLLWGLVWRLLLAEKGERTWHGNFSWGYMLAAYLVWFTAVRSYLKLYFSEQMTGNKRGVGFVLATVVLAAHLISGVYYLIYLIVLGNGM